MLTKSIFNTIIFIIVFFPPFLFSQTSTISGFVKELGTGEAIVGAKIYSQIHNKGAVTNSSGYYTLSLPSSEYRLTIYSYGFKSKKIAISLIKDTIVNIDLMQEKTQEFEEISILSRRSSSFEENRLGTIDIPIEQLKNIPNLTGEQDVIKAYGLMPGVKSGTEGSSNLFVRGGTPDQNLFLLDHTPLYYVSHIGGFISTFDPNAINSIKLYKGGFPARYNGRLSSVIDISMKDGNQKKIKGEVSVGVLSSKFQIDGPYSKDSTITYFFSARRFNLDILTRLIARIDTKGESSAGYTFYDINGKIVKRFDDGGKLSFTMYEGRDRIFINSNKKAKSSSDVSYRFKSNIKWGNLMGNISYTKPINKKLFGDFAIASTNFKYLTDVNNKYSNPGENQLENQSRIKFESGVNDLILRGHLEYEVNYSYKLITGGTSTYHSFKPGKIEQVSEINNNNTVIGNKRVQAWENNLFVENKIKLGNRINLDLGLNLTNFQMSDTTFNSIQPRLLASWDISKKIALQGGYSKMNQNMHYLTNSGVGLPSDLWIPVSKTLLPEESHQFNLGLTFQLSNKKMPLNFVMEGYYKEFSNLIDYREGSNLFQASELEEKVVANGTGTVYGIELLVQKKIGKLTGWISYTLSKNMRQFKEINNGEPFPFAIDRRHDLSVVLSYSFNDKVQLTGTWVFATGRPVTISEEKYDLLDIDYNHDQNSINDEFQYFNEAHIYNGKNNYRLPSFHKLDIGLKLMKRKEKGIRTWYFGVYNLYNRQNPFILFYQQNESNNTSLHQLTLFPIIPSISYSFRF